MRRFTRHQLRCLEDLGVGAWVQRDPPTGRAAVADGHSRDTGESVPAPDAAEATVADAGAGDIRAIQWDDLIAAVQDCRRCPLHRSRQQAVVGVGARDARLLIIGEAPGAEEDRRGEPFVGRAGQLLDRMLYAIGLSREAVYITNILKSRPPDNRDPTAEEVAACEPFLQRQIELVEPAVILAMGRVAAQNLLGSTAPLGRLRGRWHAYGPAQTPLWASYHPAYLLRRPEDKRKAWADLCAVRAGLGAY